MIQDPDADTIWFYHPQGGLFHNGRNHNQSLIDLIEAGRWETDPKKRQRIYFAIKEEFYNQYMDIWLFWENGVRAFRKKVQGWNNNMFIENRTLYTSSHPWWFKDGHP